MDGSTVIRRSNLRLAYCVSDNKPASHVPVPLLSHIFFDLQDAHLRIIRVSVRIFLRTHALQTNIPNVR